MTKISKFTDAELTKILQLYNSNMKAQDIADKFNICLASFYKLLNKQNINLRGPRKYYTIDNHYFDVINTERKAYWLGFLYADGYNNEQKGYVALSLAEIDKEILIKFNQDIQSTRPLLRIKPAGPNSQAQYRAVISDKHFCKSLNNLGCHQNKTFTIQFPTEKQVPKHLLRHFLRGCWDGDGCFTIDKNRRKSSKFYAELVSTLDFCITLQSFLKDLGIRSSIKQRRGKTTTTRTLKICSKYSSLRFLEFLYQDATVFLKRKYDKWLSCRDILL